MPTWGLSGGFGTVTVGRGLAPNFLPSILSNPMGDSFTFAPLILHMNVPLFNGTRLDGHHAVGHEAGPTKSSTARRAWVGSP